MQLAWAPRAYLLKGFMSDDECQHLIDLAKPSMAKSTVADNETGKNVPSTIRTSTGTFLRPQQDDIVARLEKRIAQVCASYPPAGMRLARLCTPSPHHAPRTRRAVARCVQARTLRRRPADCVRGRR